MIVQPFPSRSFWLRLGSQVYCQARPLVGSRKINLLGQAWMPYNCLWDPVWEELMLQLNPPKTFLWWTGGPGSTYLGEDHISTCLELCDIPLYNLWGTWPNWDNTQLCPSLYPGRFECRAVGAHHWEYPGKPDCPPCSHTSLAGVAPQQPWQWIWVS